MHVAVFSFFIIFIARFILHCTRISSFLIRSFSRGATFTFSSNFLVELLIVQCFASAIISSLCSTGSESGSTCRSTTFATISILTIVDSLLCEFC